MAYETWHGIEYFFSRRRYGTGANQRTFTWLYWRKAGSSEWLAYGGDPWMKIRLNKKELAKALHNIQARTLQIGDRVRLHTGAEARVESHPGNDIGVSTEHGVFVVPPTAIVEVL